MYNTFPVSFSMDEATLDQLQDLADRHGTNRSDMVRRLIKQANNGPGKIVAAHLAGRITAEEAMEAIAASPLILGSE